MQSSSPESSASSSKAWNGVAADDGSTGASCLSASFDARIQSCTCMLDIGLSKKKVEKDDQKTSKELLRESQMFNFLSEPHLQVAIAAVQHSSA